MKTNVESIVADAQRQCRKVLDAIVTSEFSDDRAKEDIKIDVDRIIDVARDQPKLIAYYGALHSYARSAVSRCDTAIDVLQGELYDYYMNDYHVSLKQSDIKYYITHDTKYRSLVLHREEMKYWVNKFSSVLKAFESRGFTINNLTKLLIMKHEQGRYEA